MTFNLGGIPPEFVPFDAVPALVLGRDGDGRWLIARVTGIVVMWTSKTHGVVFERWSTHNVISKDGSTTP